MRLDCLATPRHRTWAAAISALPLFFGTVGLHAAQPPCSLRFDRVDPFVWSGRASRGYDPLDPVERWQDGWIALRHEGGACAFAVAVEGAPDPAEREAQGPGSSLRYRLTSTDGRPLRDLPLGGSGSLLTGVFGAGQGALSLSYRITLPAGQTPLPGTYREAIPLRLFSADPSGAQDTLTEAGNGLLQAAFEVLPSLELTLDGLPGGGRELDLGDLSRGSAQSFRVRVRGNAPHHLEIRSESGGFLLLERPGAAGDGSRIPYRLRLQGREVALGEGSAVVVEPSPGGLGSELGIEILVDRADGAAAGSYRDTLLLSVEAE